MIPQRSPSSGRTSPTPQGHNPQQQRPATSGAFGAGMSPRIKLEQATRRLDELIAENSTVAAAKSEFESTVNDSDKLYGQQCAQPGSDISSLLEARDVRELAARQKYEGVIARHPDIKEAYQAKAEAARRRY